jgi:hypothetical protein
MTSEIETDPKGALAVQEFFRSYRFLTIAPSIVRTMTIPLAGSLDHGPVCFDSRLVKPSMHQLHPALLETGELRPIT